PSSTSDDPALSPPIIPLAPQVSFSDSSEILSLLRSIQASQAKIEQDMASMEKSISSLVSDVSIRKEAQSQEKTPDITPSAQLDPTQVPTSDSETVKEKDPAQ
ncbi:hypothetical protein U1Q18_007368, partial [Sarracenia purpurea var. burkii]